MGVVTGRLRNGRLATPIPFIIRGEIRPAKLFPDLQNTTHRVLAETSGSTSVGALRNPKCRALLFSLL